MNRRGKLMVFVDGECSVCRVTSSVVSATDRHHTTEVADYRCDKRYRDHGITGAEATARLQAINTATGKVYAGFAALRAIAREVPLLWPLRPLLALLAVMHIGDPLYDFVAQHRPKKPRPSRALRRHG